MKQVSLNARVFPASMHSAPKNFPYRGKIVGI